MTTQPTDHVPSTPAADSRSQAAAAIAGGLSAGEIWGLKEYAAGHDIPWTLQEKLRKIGVIRIRTASITDNGVTDLGRAVLAALGDEPAPETGGGSELAIVCHSMGDELVDMLRGYGVSKDDIMLLDKTLWNDSERLRQRLQASEEQGRGLQEQLAKISEKGNTNE